MPSSKVEAELLRARVREELLKGYRPLEVARRLEVSKSAVYRHIEAIYKEDANWINDFKVKGLAVSSYRLSLDSLQRHKRNMMEIAEDRTKNPAFRVMAGKEIRETEELILELQTEGPVMWSLNRRGEADKAKATEQIPR